ncbi:HIRAN domain-containing protein [Rhodococcus sp. UNC363MFTsu5.1]|uniref:HIRAN domain-containing protein n=1 Tax=Rhodococcus sp. UNC363MFTsu5.1 TaxID=1449069 RepID=UPI0018CC5981|nr:HIRAN domain-containing protein [Rhodococcus sp. UNC363MFTsu5.1]
MSSATVPFELWRKGDWDRREVAGESHHEAAIRRLYAGRIPENGSELDLVAYLVPEPHNPHDSNAVSVEVGGAIVGYLPREDAVRYSPVLRALTDQGLQPFAPCQVWASEWEGTEWDDRGRAVPRTVFRARVTVGIGEPHLCVPANLPPQQGHVMLPYGSAVQIGGEDKHMDAIAPFLRSEGECWAYATLHAVTEQLARTSREVVEVRLDGRLVGQMTPKMSESYLPVIAHLAETGRLTAARALVKGNRLKAEVVIHALRAHELPAHWPEPSTSAPAAPPHTTGESIVPAQQFVDVAVLAPSVTVHAPIPPKPIHIRFNPAPGWPESPDGWEPFPGWSPDSSWPAAPEGWSFWVAE